MTGSTFSAVLAELAHEHAEAIGRHGFTEEHDDQHGDADWAWRLLRRVSELMAPPTVLTTTAAERRRALLEVAHIAASAVAAHDRRAAAEALAVGDVVDQVAEDLRPGELVVAEGGGFVFVARAENPGAVERHRLDCDTYRDGTCTGCAPSPKGPE